MLDSSNWACPLSARNPTDFPHSARDFGNLAEYDSSVANDPRALLVLFTEAREPAEVGMRAAVRERHAQVVESLNRRYTDVLRSPWEPAGDEAMRAVVALPELDDAATVVRARAARISEMSFEMVLRMHPVALRLGLGCAEGKEAVALQRAREAAIAAARARLFAQVRGFETLGAARGSDAAVGGAWSIAGALTRSWTDRQAQFVRWVLRDGVLDWRRDPPRFVKERRRKEIAIAFGVSPSVVTESLQSADVTAFRHALWSAAWLLAGAWQPSVLEPA